MPYTVWSRGRLVGESELAYVRCMPGLRSGDFEPSAIGEKLLPIILGVGPALRSLHDAADKARDEAESVGRELPVGDWPDTIRHTTEYADAMSIPDELESLALELRDPAGAVVKTDWIAVQDTHRLIAIAREELAAVDPDLDFEDDDVEPWQPAPPRYQIMVGLEGFDDHMSREAKKRR